MKRLLMVIGAMTLLAFISPPAARAEPAPPTIDLLNPPAHGLLTLHVGQSYVFDIEITSDEPFVLAMALGDEYYPGRGVFYHGNDTAHHATSAILHLTIKGKEPTDFLPDGVAPIAVVAGVRYKRGVVVSERFDMNVMVVP
jgi:hypothetical protein